MTEPTQQQPPTGSPTAYYGFRLRRRTAAAWFAWLLWLMALLLLVEYAMASFAEYEQQAGILASVMAVGWLIAGMIVELMKTVEVRAIESDSEFQRDSNDFTSG